jgi:hypothetical protein
VRPLRPDAKDPEDQEKLVPIYKFKFDPTGYKNIKEFVLEIDIPIKEKEKKMAS